MEHESIARWAKRAREGARLSQREAAVQAQCRAETLSRLENGRTADPAWSLIQRLAAIYGVSAPTLPSGTESVPDEAA
jgi:transcriptional regulator with XRE-family HTH domain